MNAMEEMDITLTADVLQYDLMELISELESMMKILIYTLYKKEIDEHGYIKLKKRS